MSSCGTFYGAKSYGLEGQIVRGNVPWVVVRVLNTYVCRCRVLQILGPFPCVVDVDPSSTPCWRVGVRQMTN